ncbi:DUF4291 domain-containing protein [Ohtaekwangia kribbensis]|jgi:hypothetical protein|uniref:DUF4291 domain-containing protein n=1 Tax=Ohtaekwangia kribbensis TaxID=688913 RepID=A0ABW3JWV2_9BACT
MNLERYEESNNRLPKEGRHILGSLSNNTIVVYQAYRQSIADYAVKHQHFGGEFSYNRMSWIKPNFLWMMYRSGWAEKEGQENILAITLSTEHFDEILNKAVISSFNKEFYNTEDAWKKDLTLKDVRLQWDPDHDPWGNKLERRAVQLGLKDDTLKKYGKEFILKIENITPFVKEQHEHLKSGRIDMLQVPYESIYVPKSKDLASKIGLSL